MLDTTVGRRRFLLAGSAALLVAGCSPRGAAPDAPTPGAAPTTTRQLLRSPLFHVAHRGSGDNWTEHSLDAYQRSLRAGADAVEISVTTTKDGVLVCHHDLGAKRLTGVDREISDLTFKELSELRLDARRWLGPKAPTQPVARLEDVLATLGDDFLALVEDKKGTSTQALLDLLDQQPRAASRFVWKQWVKASQYRAAKERGYLTWGYLTPELVDRVEEFAERFDSVGVPTGTSDAGVARVVAAGRPVIAYEVHDRSSRTRLQKLGVAGMMCSNVPYVLKASAPATADSFVTGLRPAGDLPAAVDRGWDAQPTIQPVPASLRFDRDGRTSYLMGSMCPVRPEPYRLLFSMRWPDGLPNTDDHAGVAFALESDAPYVAKQKSATGGYHAVVRANGRMGVYGRDAGTANGVLLGSAVSDAAEPGEWINLELVVDQDRITFTRVGDPTWKVQVEDNQRRGGYIRLAKNYEQSTALEFSSVAVRAV